MNAYLRAEWLKTKHTTLRKMTVLIPAVCLLMAGGFCLLGGMEVIRLADVTTLNHWALVWLPAAVALLAGLLHKLERKSTGYRTVFGSPVNPAKVWLAKNISIAALLLLASLLLWIGVAVFDLLFLGTETSADTLLRCLIALLVSWTAVLWQIPLYLWLAQKISYFALILLSCGLSILAGTEYAPESNWWAVPWAWVLRLQAPLLKLHPNGIPLEAGSPLLQYDGFPQAILISVVLLAAVAVLSTALFTGRKGRKG